jgi:hypothetical protein
VLWVTLGPADRGRTSPQAMSMHLEFPWALFGWGG